ncbi:MAG: DnaJ domain-containing protein [Betaproteobacteria bacterium]|nr:DnaJ domain-containing protein [Betaproteobacteria bacterium]
MDTHAKADYYEVLGIPRDADARAIKDAFRHLALKYHPDRNKEPGAEERFKEIAEAYAVLSDPNKRAGYDAGGHAGMGHFSPEDLFGGIDFEDLFSGLGGLGAGLGGGLFERFFRHHRAGPPRGEDLQVLLSVPLATVARGGEETVRIARPTACTACHGTGARAGTAPRPCEACHGSGRQVKSGQEGGVRFQQVTTCPACQGRGSFIDQPCPECHGSGRVEREETLKLRIPAGIEDGTALRVAGHGMPGPEEGGVPGDLLVVVHAAPDPRFQRAGADLWRVEELLLTDAVLGAERSVPTLDGPVAVTVPHGTQPDAVLRLRGRGLPRPGDGRHGDLLLRLRVRVPEKLTAEERSLYERLRQLAESGEGRRSAGAGHGR